MDRAASPRELSLLRRRSRGARRRTSTTRSCSCPADRRRSMSRALRLPAAHRRPRRRARAGRREGRGRSTRWRPTLDAALGGRRRRLARPPRPGRHGRPARDPRAASPRGHRRRLDGHRAAGLATFDELTDYCYHVASVVGLCCLHIWGYRSDGGQAEATGRGVRRRAAADQHPPRRPRGRPQRADLPAPRRPGAVRRRAGGADVVRPPRSRVRALFDFEARRAYTYYETSAPLARLVAPVGRPVLRAIVGIYRALLDEIARRDYNVLSERVRIPAWRKAAIALGSLRAGSAEDGGRACRSNNGASPVGFAVRVDLAGSPGERSRTKPLAPCTLGFAPPNDGDPAGTRDPGGRQAGGAEGGRCRSRPMTPFVRPAPPRVVIVGGGLAGLAAAVGLAGKDLDITLLESRPRLGGRASSFPDPATGELVDNCQHVSMACCTNLADFCRRVGTADLFRREPGVLFLSPEGRYSTLRAGPLPAPFHLTGSFLRANYLTLTRTAPRRLRARPAASSTRRISRPSRSTTGSAGTARPTGRSSATGPPCSSRP